MAERMFLIFGRIVSIPMVERSLFLPLTPAEGCCVACINPQYGLYACFTSSVSHNSWKLNPLRCEQQPFYRATIVV